MEMLEITVPTYHIEKDKILDILKVNDIYVNEYARLFFEHSKLYEENLPPQIKLVLCPLSELGLSDGAVLEDIITNANSNGLRLCHMSTGVFFRLLYVNQPESEEHILSGTCRSPDGAVIVLSEFPEEDDLFPKGLYLRNVDGKLWLRGYVCDKTYGWSADAVFAFEKMTE